MFGRSSLRGGILRPENIAQNAISTIASLCFSVFVIVVLIFTIISIVYDPEDPFFRSSSPITKFLSSDSKPTFKSDGGVLRTGEDMFASDQTAFVNVTDVESAVMGVGFEEFTEIRECRVADPINCRDLDVFHLLMRAAIEEFNDVHFYKFGKPVEGDNSSSCHMAWRFRPKEGEGKLSAFNKDYRSFRVLRSENCTLSVVGIGGYHSGGNARKKKAKGAGKVPATSMDNLDIGDTVNDGLPMVESEGSFSDGKYLIYVGGGDRCKSMHQYLWSFTCMLGEAQFLNRTLVMDLSLCLSKMYSSSGVDEEGKDFRFYFDLEHLKDSASVPVLDQAQFWSDWNKWREGDGLKLHLVEDFRVGPMKLAEVKDSLIMRKFGGVEPDNFWHRVCEGEAGSVIQRPWHMIWKSRRLLDVASAIAARMNWDFDGVHVERGEKAKNKKLWPHLGRDTSPKSLVAKLRDRVEDGRNVYIATDEPRSSHFDPLKEKYSIHFLDDYKDLWDANSDWYYEMTKLNNGNPLEFDGYMKLSVDSEVFFRGKKQIETFNDLTKDCKDGVNTC